MDIMVSLKNVCKQFGDNVVLKDISHDFEAGKIHGIIGNNGSGKTVLFKCICGFMHTTSGNIFVDYEQVGKDMDFPDDIGIIIETPGFLPQYTGLKNLEILASLRKRIDKEQIIKTLKLVGLDPALKTPVSKYSLGMRQRLGIAQAIMENPSLMILDEPLNGLDKHGVAEIRKLLQSFKQENKTIIMASHNAEDIRVLCDTVCEIDAGILTLLS